MSAPPFVTTHELAGLPGITHGFFGRRGGVSEGLYASLNIGQGSGDDAKAIRTNRERVRDALGADHLLSCFQVHSTRVVEATERWIERPQADAMVTTTPGLALCILSADCAPILFADPVARVIGAAHAGWKGALAGVAQETVKAMVELGATHENIHASIGPTIQQASYEVGPEFRDAFIEQNPRNGRFFAPSDKPGDRLHFDLPAYLRAMLLREGVSTVENLGHDTCAMEAEYFSNRRRNLRSEADYGRNGSAIMLKAEEG